MRPHVVVVLPPSFDHVAGLAQALEPVLVQTLVPQPAIEALDERVVHWLARPDEVDRDAASVRPQIQCSPRELGSTVEYEGVEEATSRLQWAIPSRVHQTRRRDPWTPRAAASNLMM